MAAKAQSIPQDNTGSFVLSQNSPPISLASAVLASIVPLPEHPLIVYSIFACRPATSDPLEQLEVARRTVLLKNKGQAIVDSLLPAVHVSKDSAALYVFALGSTACTCDVHGVLSRLEFETLICA
ncbi:hypothetical protein BD310DRAFT_214459 [Dichomitus squalens]|uniref:Mediator complex subunit Med13 N-terminal domain-containing protein n=1 Tax=Dichomitus squalens TaxID=114155 RepID=A0A4Q9Q2N0_9APHY|nr:hypothetical protein BD310DRAFT_214459 [Dichomitus squalens]